MGIDRRSSRITKPSSNHQPASTRRPQKGDLWIHEETLVEYAWDGTQWFEVGSSCGGGSEEDEEEKDLYFPFVNSFRLVAPDDFIGDDGTATILTSAYDAGDDSYLSPV